MKWNQTGLQGLRGGNGANWPWQWGFIFFVVRCKSQASFIELSEELRPEDLPDELLMLLIVPVDNYTTNESWLRGWGWGWRGGHSGLMERSLANFMGLRQQAIGYQFAWMNEWSPVGNWSWIESLPADDDDDDSFERRAIKIKKDLLSDWTVFVC